MNQYYLIAQLPSLEIAGETTALPITEELFFELCRSNLGKKAWNALSGLTLVPKRQDKKSGYSVIDRWNGWERNFRLALAGARAEKMKKPFEGEKAELSGELFQKIRRAVEMEDPLEAERYLTRIRLDYLETLRPADSFSETMLFYYALKLKLILRLQRFDKSRGQSAYREIYSSIMHGGDPEVKE